MTPIYTVEEPDEWRMEVYSEYIITVDYYEDFAEIVFV
jgi:hypothetical protein